MNPTTLEEAAIDAYDHYSSFGKVQGSGHDQKGTVFVYFEKLHNGVRLHDVPKEYKGWPVKANVTGKVLPA